MRSQDAASPEDEAGIARNRPNIVVILSDDQGPWALGAAGNDEIRTPNLDHLAATGTRFENFFCTSPVCSPARASLLTGRIPSQHGIHDWLRGGNIGDDAIEYLSGQPAYTEMLANNGYVCGLSGKWHLGDSITPQKGYSHWFAHQTGGGPYTDAPMIRDGELINQPGYLTEAITDDALAFLDERATKDAPFHLSVHYTAPHSPWIGEHPQDIVDSYDDCPFASCPQEPEHPWSLRNTVPASARTDPRANLKGYFAAVTAMDDNIGRIVRRLEALGLRESTVICFLSDNGFNCGHHGIWGKGNGTFPQNMYDSSVKVPAIWSHPGRIAEGVVRRELVSGYDFMPTLLDYVGLENPDAAALPGTSFLGLLSEGQNAAQREHVVVFDEYGPVRMIRTDDWKYVHRFPYGPHELYDLARDPGERVNLVDDPAYADRRSTLERQLREWFLMYVRTEVDGVREPVTGKGQLARTGTGAEAFAPVTVD
jgi:arylsulfatase A-like enzyme